MAKDTVRKNIGSQASVRHSYESVLSACARLYLFATGQAPESKGPIGTRQEVLVHEDLTAFAIHARRLIASTISMEAAADVLVAGMNDRADDAIAITRILNTIIHHADMKIHRTDLYFQWARRCEASGKFGPAELFGIKANRIPPLCIVTSHEDRTVAFRLKELIDVFQTHILVPVIDYCEEQNLFLDDPLMD